MDDRNGIHSMAAIKMLVRSFVSLLFFFSAVMKLADFERTAYFFKTIFGNGMTWISPALGTVILLEIMLSILLFFRYDSVHWIVPVTFSVLCLFTLFSISLYILGYENCGCFGSIIRISPFHAALKNMFCLCILWVLTDPWPHDNRSLNRRRHHLFFMMGFTLSAFLLVKLHPSERFPVGSRFPQNTLSRGPDLFRLPQNAIHPVLFVFTRPHCEHCDAQVRIILDHFHRFPAILLFFVTCREDIDRENRRSYDPILPGAANIEWLQVGNRQARERFGIRKTPAILVFDRTGILRWKTSGEIKHEVIIAAIESSCTPAHSQCDVGSTQTLEERRP